MTGVPEASPVSTRKRGMIRNRLAWVLAAIDIATILVARLIDPSGDVSAIVLYTLGVASFAAVGALLDTRVPGNPIGRLLLAAGTFMTMSMAMGTYSSLGALQVPAWPLSHIVGLAGTVLFVYPFLIALIGVPLVFPDGHLPSRRFRWIVLLTIASGAAWTISSLLGPAPSDGGGGGTPAGPDAGLVGIIQTFFLLSMIVCFAVGIAAVALRWRRGDGVQRQQIKWLAAIVSLGAAVLPISFIGQDASDVAVAVVSSLTVLSLFALPMVIGVAILRYRLYDIDRIISRTISWTLTTGLVAAVFAGIVIGLQGPLAEVTGGDTLAVAGSTLVAAALFQPLRRRVQAAVDRRFNRARYDAERIVAGFAHGLGAETSLEEVQQKVVVVVDSSLGPRGTALWVRDNAAGRST
jgi:hypothetical protein